MKIYITAPFPMLTKARTYMHVLGMHRYVITSRWLKQSTTLCVEDAVMDLADIDAADLLVALNFEGWGEKGTGGRHVELGYAIARGKRILLVGERTNVFHYHPSVTQIDEVQDFIKAVEKISRGEA